MIPIHHSWFGFITVVLASTHSIGYKTDDQFEEFSEENGKESLAHLRCGKNSVHTSTCKISMYADICN